MKRHIERVKMEEYLRTKRVRLLFQSLVAGLAKHQPENVLAYLQKCLEKVVEIGWQNVEISTFLNEVSDTSSTLSGAGVGGDVDSAERRWMKLISGSLDDLPSMPSNIVRIFISSTFSDFKAERNALLANAFPALQHYCADLGLDFQVVDLRWGVTDEMTNDHQVSALCLREIATCQRLSVGPNFVALLGDRYGYRPFPASIDAGEFDSLVGVEGLDPVAVRTVRDWYQRDDNARPPAYLLQSVASRLTSLHAAAVAAGESAAYSSEERGGLDLEAWLQHRLEADWSTASDTIQSTLRQAASAALASRDIDQCSADKYFISVTEAEIRAGMLQADTQPTLCCIRSLFGITDESTSDPVVHKFIDLKPDGATDDDAGSWLRRLKSGLVERLMAEKVLWYEARWSGHALEDDQDSHKTYLETFCRDFVARMKVMVDAGLESRTTSYLFTAGPDLGQEILHHASTAVIKNRIFCGREDTLRDIQLYIQTSGSTDRRPLIIHGLSGQGKTALMAVAAKRVIGWLPSTTRPIVVLRFLGTTPSSSDMLSVLRSVIMQLSLAVDLPVSDKLEQMSGARKAFTSLLERIRKKRHQTSVVLVLDSVDQVSRMYSGHRMTWLPRSLPANVYIIVSMLSADANDCLANTRKRLGGGGCILELLPLPDDVMQDVVELYLGAANRRLTGHQLRVVLRAVSACRQPLFVKLVLDQAAKWASYTDISPADLPRDIPDAISQLFAKVQSRYGSAFVTHALAYLTCARGGLSSIEMEDVLSCDDAVLSEVYRYHDPPLRTTIRIPSLMWVRVAEELREYLSERQVDGKTVLSWYHRQFWETAESWYLDSEQKRRLFHRNLGEIYSQEAGVQRTITLEQRRGMVLREADRQVTPQPLQPSNLRKLKCLPYHLLAGGAVEQLKAQCLLSFRWMLTWLCAEGVNTVLNDYRIMAQDPVLDQDSDVDLLSSFLQLCYDSLYYDPDLFAYHVKERIPATRQSAPISRFVRDAGEYLASSTAPRMLPTHTMKFPSITGPLRSAVMVGEDGLLSGDGSKVVCTWTGALASKLRVQVLSLSTFEVLASVPLWRQSPVVVTRDSQYFVVLSDRYVQLREMDTGDVYKEVKHWLQNADDLITPRCLAVSNNGVYLAVGVRLAGRPNTDQPRTCSVISLFQVASLGVAGGGAVRDQTLAGRKVISSLLFTADDSHLVSISINSICVFSVPHLEVLHQFNTDSPRIFASTLFPVPGSALLVLGAGVRDGARALTFSMQDFSTDWSPLAHLPETLSMDCQEDLELVPFGVALNLSPFTLVLGTRIKESKKRLGYGELWISHDATGRQWTTRVALGVGLFKFPCVMLVLPGWQRALIGWSNGDLGVVDLVGGYELWFMHAHVHAINMLCLCRRDECLVSLAADNYLKLWNVARLLQTADRHAHRRPSPLPSPLPTTQLPSNTSTADNPPSPREQPDDPKYFREASYSSCGDLSTPEGSTVDLLSAADPQTADHQLTPALDKQEAQPSEQLPGTGAMEDTSDKNVKEGRKCDREAFPREYFREASCTYSPDDDPMSDLSAGTPTETQQASSFQMEEFLRLNLPQAGALPAEQELGEVVGSLSGEEVLPLSDLSAGTPTGTQQASSVQIRRSLRPQAGALPLEQEMSGVVAQAGGVLSAEEEILPAEHIISAAEQCVDATVFAQHLVIASHINEEAPKFWHLHSGALDAEMTSQLDQLYKRSLEAHNIEFSGRNHAQLFTFHDFLIYIRKRSTEMTVCVLRRAAADRGVAMVAHSQLHDAYLTVFLPESQSTAGPFSMYVVRDGVLEHRSADMALMTSIAIPRMTDDIPNMTSSSGKKRLLSYTVAVTQDRRYFLIVCPTAGGQTSRYMDVVDLLEHKYLQRTGLNSNLVWRVLEDSVYYLVRRGRAQSLELATVRTLPDDRLEYCCLTESDLQIRSPDRDYGVEIGQDHRIHVWRTADARPRLCCSLIGHVAEVTCVSWGGVKARLLVSGSRDNTVRLWSLADCHGGPGRQLCLFHVLGNIDNVHFDATLSYVVAHCSYAPQRKRAIVLRITNV